MAVAGNIVIDLVGSNQGVYGISYGSFTLSLSSLTTQMATYTGTIIPAPGMLSIPPGLLLRVWGQNLPAGADYEIDRIEVFPTNEPVLTNKVLASYEGEPEQVDGVTGQLKLASQSVDPAMGAQIIHNTLYFQKKSSAIEVEDAANYEPSQWTTRAVSQRVGTCGPNAFDYGDEWGLTLHESGIFAFNGAVPMPIAQELSNLPYGESLWDQINWAAKRTFWLSNDLRVRRFYVGVAMATPNFWLPNAPLNPKPIQPNVILMCNYSGVPSYSELEEGAPVHVTMFGALKALDMRRKWSIWQIKSPYGAVVSDGVQSIDTIYLCNGTKSGKIYRLQAPSIQNSDDGVPIRSLYTTYGWTSMPDGLQKGIGAGQKLATHFMADVQGEGSLQMRFYPNTLGATYPQTSPLSAALDVDDQNNIERKIEVRGQRIYTELSQNQTGTPTAGYWECGEMSLEIVPHPWGTYRGVAK